MRPNALAAAVCALCVVLLSAMPVVAGEEPKSPVAFGAFPNPAVAGQTVRFQALADDAQRVRWDLDGDGSFETDGGSSPVASRTYAQPGTVTVGLRVTDGDGDERQATAAVVVSGPEVEDPAPPTEAPADEPGSASGDAAGPDSGAGLPGPSGGDPVDDDGEADREPTKTGRPEDAESLTGLPPTDRPRQQPAPGVLKGRGNPPVTPRAVDRMPRLRPIARIAATSVGIENFAFSPSTINVEVGETVTWTNRDGVSHSAEGKGFDTGLLRTGEAGSETFEEAGTYSYICGPHRSMTGTVRVTAAGGGGSGGGGSGGSGGGGSGSGGNADGAGGGSRFSIDGSNLDDGDLLNDETTSGADGDRGGSDLPTTGLDLALLVAVGLLLLLSGALLRRAAALRPA